MAQSLLPLNFVLYPCPQGFEAGVKNWYTVKAPLLLGGVSRSDGVVIVINLISRNHLPLRVLLLKGGEFFYLLLTIHYFTIHYFTTSPYNCITV
jgi:hypothetical protein